MEQEIKLKSFVEHLQDWLTEIEEKDKYHFDYDLQVWVRGGVIQDCGHPANMSTPDYACCNGRKYHGQQIVTVRAQLGLE